MPIPPLRREALDFLPVALERLRHFWRALRADAADVAEALDAMLARWHAGSLALWHADMLAC